MEAPMERIFNKDDNENEKSGGKVASSFASLTAGLMARKGEASPAPAHLDGVSIHSHGVEREPLTYADRQYTQAPHERLFQPPRPVSSLNELQGPPTPAPSPEPTVPQPQEAEAVAEPAPEPVTEPVQARGVPAPDEPEPVPEEVLKARAARLATVSQGDCCALPMPPAVTETLPPGPYAKVTTRLDRERVRKLKIIAARMETTNQKVLLAALDHYLDYACNVLASECPCLARSLKDTQ